MRRYQDMFNVFGFGGRKLPGGKRTISISQRKTQNRKAKQLLTLTFVAPFTDFSKFPAIVQTV